MPRGRPKGSTNKPKTKTTTKTTDDNAEASAKIGNINIHIETDHEEKKRKPRRRTKIVKEMVPTPVYPKPNYTSSQLSGHVMNSNTHFANNSAASDYAASTGMDPMTVVNNIEGPTYEAPTYTAPTYNNNPTINPVFNNQAQELKPEEQKKEEKKQENEQKQEQAQTEEQIKPKTESSALTADKMQEMLDNDAWRDFAMNTAANTAGTIGGVAGLAAANHLYKNKDSIGETLGNAGKTVLNTLSGLVGGKKGKVKAPKPPKPPRQTRTQRLMKNMRSDGYSVLTETSTSKKSNNSSSGFTGNSDSASYDMFKKKQKERIERDIEARRLTTEVTRIETPNRRLTTEATRIETPSAFRTPTRRLTTEATRIEMKPNVASSSPAYQNLNVLESFVNRTPTRNRAQESPLRFSPIAQAPATQVQNRVRPTPFNHSTSGSSPFIRPSPRRSESAQNIISEIRPVSQASQRSFHTPQNTEHVTTRRRVNNNDKAAASNSRPSSRASNASSASIFPERDGRPSSRASNASSRAGTPAAAMSNSLDQSLHMLSGGILGSTTKPKTPSQGVRYRQGYLDRVKVDKNNEKAKPWTRETNMNSPYWIAYYGSRNDTTIENYMDRTPPAKSHNNRKLKKDKEKKE